MKHKTKRMKPATTSDMFISRPYLGVPEIDLSEDGFQWEVGMVCENNYGWQAEVRRVEDDAVIIGRSVFHLDGKPSAPYGGRWVTPDPGNSVKRIVKWPEP